MSPSDIGLEIYKYLFWGEKTSDAAVIEKVFSATKEKSTNVDPEKRDCLKNKIVSVRPIPQKKRAASEKIERTAG